MTARPTSTSGTTGDPCTTGTSVTTSITNGTVIPATTISAPAATAK